MVKKKIVNRIGGGWYSLEKVELIRFIVILDFFFLEISFLIVYILGRILFFNLVI